MAVNTGFTVLQITTFTNWVNDRLKVGKHDRKVRDLFLDLKDGMLLIKLLENLTKKKVKGFTGKVPKTEAHKIVNLDLAFQFMESERIKLVGVGKVVAIILATNLREFEGKYVTKEKVY